LQGDVATVLKTLANSRERRRAAARLVSSLIAQARAPIFFTKFNVPDTIDGRFDLVTLHAFLVLERLESAGRRDLSQALTDAVFAGFDEGLRDLGAGDLGMGRRMKKMANAFYGRLNAYRAAADRDALSAALLRNVYRGEVRNEAPAGELARYIEGARAAIATSDLDSGDAQFGPLPEGPRMS
jgi:cytochrome b pre-mRNA-processing protein 3